MEKQKVVLEPSTNTHVLETKSQPIVTNKYDNGTMVVKNAEGIITHGEHGTLSVEKKNVIKFVQTEYNPVTKAIQNAWD